MLRWNAAAISSLLPLQNSYQAGARHVHADRLIIDRKEAHVPLIISQPVPYVTQIVIDNQAKRNAMSRDMMVELADLWDQLDADDDCRCIVLTGAGDKAFCAGADIGGDLSHPRRHPVSSIEHCSRRQPTRSPLLQPSMASAPVGVSNCCSRQIFGLRLLMRALAAGG